MAFLIIWLWVSFLEFATKKSQFVFNDKYYEQIDGRGLAVGPSPSKRFYLGFEEKWVRTSKSRTSVWFRCVDDTFAMFDDKESVFQFLQYLNSRHNNIKFTIEFEGNCLVIYSCKTLPWQRFHAFHFTLNGTHSFLANMCSISSVLSPIVASEFALHLSCFKFLSPICENLFFKMTSLKG